MSMPQPATTPAPISFTSEIVERPALVVVGRQVQSSHETVATEAGPLWGAATSDPRLQRALALVPPEDAGFVGVYSNYESDFSGAYSMLVGVPGAIASVDDNADLTEVTLPAGTYARIVIDAPNPSKVGQAWAYTWKELDCRDQRTYVADYEIHTHTTATLYIGIAPVTD